MQITRNAFIFAAMGNHSSDESFATKGGWTVVVQLCLMTAVIVAAPWTGHLTMSPQVASAASFLIISGGYFGIAGISALGRNRTAYPKPRGDGKLVTSGVFRRVRHPLYTSVTLIGFGWALLWQSWPAAGLSLLMAAQLYYKSLLEEAWLRTRFPHYSDYASRVKRFIPWLW